MFDAVEALFEGIFVSFRHTQDQGNVMAAIFILRRFAEKWLILPKKKSFHHRAAALSPPRKKYYSDSAVRLSVGQVY